MNEGLTLKATAVVMLTKLDERGNVIEVTEHEVDLTKEEVDALWHSLPQE